MSGKKFAVFDIDGTVIRDSLFLQIVDELIARGDLPIDARAKLDQKWDAYYRRAHDDAFREYELESVNVLFGNISKITETQYKQAVDTVIENMKDVTYTYTRNLIKKLKKRGYFLIALSGSEMYAIQEFTKTYGFDVSIGETYVCKDGTYTGEVLYVFDRKNEYLQRIVRENGLTFEGSIGVGDSRSDVSMLELVEEPIAFNPEKRLLTAAKEHGWKVVVERKNVIYELNPKNGSYTLEEIS